MSVAIWWFAPAIATAAGLFAWAWRRGAPGAGAWGAAGIIGQASALSLIKAGPLVGYQHLSPVADAARDRPFAQWTVLVLT